MMLPYTLITIIFLVCTVTLPGALLQKFLRDFIIKYFKVDVYEVEYFEIDNPVGYTIDQPVSSLKQTLAFVFIPFIIFTLICALFTFPHQAIEFFNITNTKVQFVIVLLGWIGISAALVLCRYIRFA